jgi:hypothetical protein
MRTWYDCEFLEDGKTTELISIAMIREDDARLYMVNEEIAAGPLYDRIRAHPWLMKHVVPHLPLKLGRNGGEQIRIPDVSDPTPGWYEIDMGTNVVAPRRMIANAVRDFVLEHALPQLWAWYGAYDHVVVCQLFGRMLDLPKGFPMWTNDLKQEVERLGNPTLPQFNMGGEHDPQAEVAELREWHRYLERYEHGKDAPAYDPNQTAMLPIYDPLKESL